MSDYKTPQQLSDETIARLLQEEEARLYQQEMMQRQYNQPQNPQYVTRFPPMAPPTQQVCQPPKPKPWYKNIWMWLALILIASGVAVGIAFLIKNMQTVRESPTWLDSYNKTWTVPVPNCKAAQAKVMETEWQIDEATNQRDVDCNAAGMDQLNSDNFDALTRCFQDCRNSNGCRIFVRPGVYRFTKQEPLFLRNVEGVTIDGQGSLFLFRRESVFSRFFAFESTNKLVIKNLRIDWDWSRWRVASLVQVLSATPLTMDLKFMETNNITLESIHAWFDFQAVDENDFTYGVRDENRQGQYFGLDSYISGVEKIYPKVNVSEWDPKINQTVIVERNATVSDHVRLYLKMPLLPTPSGYYLIRHFSYEGHALQFVRCTNCRIQNVTIYSAIGMAIAFHEDSHHVEIVDTKVTIFQNVSSDSPRWYTRHISTAADGINFINTQGYIKILNTQVGFQGDDCLNINDRITLGFVRQSDNVIIASDWEKLRVNWKAGDTVKFMRQDLSPTDFFATVAESSWVGGQGWRLVLDRTVPTFSNDSTMILVNGRFKTSNIIIRGLHCHSNRARGVLLQGSNTLLENSCFTNEQKAAVKITSERNPGKWAEGSGVRNVVVRGNVFDNVDELDDYNGVVKVIAEMGVEGTASPYAGAHQNISIIDNIFANMPRRSIMISSSSKVLVKGNRIVNDAASAPETGERGQMLISRSNGINIQDNVWTGSYTAESLIEQGPDVKNLTDTGNVVR